MAFEPDAVDGLAEGVARIYADAEVQLLARVAAAIQKGIDTPEWVTTQLAEIARLSAQARGFLLTLEPAVAAEIQAALGTALTTGATAADQDIPGPPPSSPPVVATEAVAALAAEATATVLSTHGEILRSTVDTYRSVVAEVSGRVVTGVATRREVTQQALDKFAAQGVTAFRDRAGRRWRLDTYTEMAVRTATLRALKQGHTNRLVERGYDIVVISSHPRSAPQCVPFQGALVSLTGAVPNGPLEAPSRMTGETVRETVVASMAEAEAAGLHHPNCRHNHRAWIPGAPRPPVEPDDPQGYADEQKLRRLERAVREAKRLQAVAITPEAKRKAAKKLRDRQAAIRDHVDRTGVPRRRHREQLRDGDAARATESVKLNRVDPDAARPLTPVAAAETPAEASPKKTRTKREFADLTDEQIDDEMVRVCAELEPDLDLLDRLGAEADHRRKLAQKRAERWAGYEREYDRLVAEGMDHESAVEKAYGISVKTQRSQQAMAMLRAQGYSGKSFNDLARQSFKDHCYRQWLEAEEATNGYMLSALGEAKGIDPRSLWHGNEATARKYASEELRAFWDQHGRTTLDEHKADLLGETGAAAQMRAGRTDFLQ